MQEEKKALIAGASGLIGSFLLKELLYDNNYSEVEIFSRGKSELLFLKLKERIVDFNSIDSLPVTPVDHVFCCLGTTIKKAGSKEAFRKVDFEYVLSLAKYAERAGASKFFVISSLGANHKSSNFYLKTKGEMEEALKNSSIPAIYILQPSLLLGKRNEFRFGEMIAQKIMPLIGFLFVGGLKKYRGIKAKVVAKAMQHLAKEDKTGIFTLDSAMIQKTGNI
jgi:uncharacterized protein YbjT (DUF2867 family)